MKAIRTPAAIALTAALAAGSALCAVAPAHAAPAATPKAAVKALDLPNTFTRMVLYDTQTPAAGSYIAIDNELRGTRASTLAEAEILAGGDYFDTPRAGQKDNSISNLEEGLDLQVDSKYTGGIGYDTDGGSIIDDDHQFDVADNGTVSSHAGGFIGFDDTSKHLDIEKDGRYRFIGSTLGTSPTTLVGHVDSYDAEVGTALIQGHASSSVFYPDTQISFDGGFVTTQPDGKFLFLISGLKPDAKDVTIDQKVDGRTFDSLTLKLDTTPPVESADVVLTNPANPADGYEENKAFTFKGTAKPGSTVTVQNVKGLVFGTANAHATTGVWEFTWKNMNTTIWSLDFVADKGTADQKTAELRGFSPKAVQQELTLTNPANAGDGYVANSAFTYKGAAKAGAKITVQNLKGLVFGTADAHPTTGAWEFTWQKMNTTVWSLDFIADKGGANEQTVELRNFAAKSASITITNPANPADGYEANKAFTYEGTVKAGAVVTVQNVKGLELGTADVDASGKWSFTWANMKTTVWSLDFVANKGTTGAETAELRGFAPRA